MSDSDSRLALRVPSKATPWEVSEVYDLRERIDALKMVMGGVGSAVQRALASGRSHNCQVHGECPDARSSTNRRDAPYSDVAAAKEFYHERIGLYVLPENDDFVT
jgi:hypothetical protein